MSYDFDYDDNESISCRVQYAPRVVHQLKHSTSQTPALMYITNNISKLDVSSSQNLTW